MKNITNNSKTGPNCQIFLIKFVLYAEVIKVENQLQHFDSFVPPGVQYWCPYSQQLYGQHDRLALTVKYSQSNQYFL
jgi:hypothetical protein